ncbi:hypothetical protein BGZ76_000889 [Entomortierella beljakovae]|nr:hypothetical protein BGZ76_000889 [Entomortierella beljakovae]
MDIQISEACCNTPATKTTWVQKGVFVPLSKQVAGVERRTYRVGPKGSKLGVVSLIDIHGFHPTTVQFLDASCDLPTLAGKGFQVSAIDLFLNGPMPDEYMGDMPKLGGWIRANADYNNSHVNEMVKIAASDLTADGCTDLFIVGHCWGTHLAIRAASEEGQVFKGVAGPHPTAVSAPLVANLKCPLALFPAMDDPDMIPVIQAVLKKGFSVPSRHVRFDTMPHGFCGGRGDWTIPEQKAAADQVLDEISSFFISSTEREI